MKSFLVALCAFTLLMIVIACNFSFINATSDELMRRLSVLNAENAAAQMPTLCAYWEQHRTLMAFSIPNAEMKTFQDRLTALSYAGRFLDPAEFERALALALEAAKDLRRLERFSPENLL